MKTTFKLTSLAVMMIAAFAPSSRAEAVAPVLRFAGDRQQIDCDNWVTEERSGEFRLSKQSCLADWGGFTWDRDPGYDYKFCMRDAGSTETLCQIGWDEQKNSQIVSGTWKVTDPATQISTSYVLPQEDIPTLVLGLNALDYPDRPPKSGTPSATQYRSFKVMALPKGGGQAVYSNTLIVPMVRGAWIKKEGNYHILYNGLSSAQNDQLTFYFRSNGETVNLFELLSPDAAAGAEIATYVDKGPQGGSLHAVNNVVSFTPPSDGATFARYSATVKATDVFNPNDPVKGPEFGYTFNLIAQNGSATDPMGFAVAPTDTIGASLRNDAFKLSYVGDLTPGSRTIYSQPSNYRRYERQAIGFFQTSGDYCPLFTDINDLKSHLAYAPGLVKACFVRTEGREGATFTSTMYQSFVQSGFTETPRLISGEIRPEFMANGPATLNFAVDVYDKAGNIAQTIKVPYQFNIVPISAFKLTLTDNFDEISPEIRIRGVTKRTSPVFNYKIEGGDPNFLKINGTNLMSDGLLRFKSESISMNLSDTRLPGYDADTEVGRRIINLEKEPIGVSVSNRAVDGSIRVMINQNRAANAHYILTAKRTSSETGETIEFPEANRIMRVGPAPTFLNVTYDSAHPQANRTLDGTNRVADIVLPKAMVDDLLATEDRLFIEANPIPEELYSELGIGLAEAKSLITQRPELFTDQLEAKGLSGYISPKPTADVVLGTQYLLTGQTSTATLIKRKNVKDAQWVVTPEGGTPTPAEKGAPKALELKDLAAGVYSVSANLFPGFGEEVSTATPVTLTVYEYPTVSFTFPAQTGLGKPTQVSAAITKSPIPADAVATWKIGNRTFPGVVSADGKTVTGTFNPGEVAANLKVSLSIQMNPATLDAIATVEAPTKISVLQDLGGDIQTTSKVFWQLKGGMFNYVGSTSTNKLDWIVTSNETGKVITKTVPGRLGYATTGLALGSYTIQAKAYDALGDTSMTNLLTFKVLPDPKATFKSLPLSAPAGSELQLIANTVNVRGDAIATWHVGDTTIPGAINTTDNTITASFTMPLVQQSFKTSLSIQVDPENPDSTVNFDVGTVKSVAYSKLNASVEAPKFLDIGATSTFTAKVKAQWDTRTLPINEDTFTAEWELPDGSRVQGTTLRWTPTMEDYTLYSAGKRPIFRGWMNDDKDNTLVTVATNAPFYEPWHFPTYALNEKAGGREIVVPGAVVLTVASTPAVPTPMQTYRGITYEWTLPEGQGLSVKAQKDTVSLTINDPGTYPLSVRVSDRYGAEQVLNYQIVAAKAQFSISKTRMIPTPDPARVPVVVVTRMETTSTHKKDRLKAVETYLDGVLVGTGQAPKPVTIKEAGQHEIMLKATSSMGNAYTSVQNFTAIPNQAPTCLPFKVSYGKAGKQATVKAAAQCSDIDGRLKKFEWTVNGQPTKTMGATQVYGFLETDNSVDIGVKVTDDSGDPTTYQQTIPAP